MSTITTTRPTTTPTTAPAELDPSVGHALGDEILLAAVAAEPVRKVKGAGTGSRTFESRAWSMGGNVD